MASTQRLLEQVAQDGTWESESWPQVLEEILTRLDKIVRSEFPIPILPPEPPPPPPPQQQQEPVSPQNALGSPLGGTGPSSQDSQASSNKENAPTKAKSPAARPPVPSFSEKSLDSTLPEDDGDFPPDYPPDLAALHKSVQKNLKDGFPAYPPHTAQRLAELILFPKKHYRHLPAYLHALDRVVSVQSTTALFPLPYSTLPGSSGGGMLNGASATLISSRSTPELGSDESLGGALLTPIPWLNSANNNRTDSQRSSGSGASPSSQNDRELQTSSTEIVEGPNGAGRIETVNVVNGVMTPVASNQSARSSGGLVSSPNNSGREDAHVSTEEALRAEGAVTQGELLRQEQEAGVIPMQPRGLRMSEREMGELAADEAAGIDEEEQLHARGPEEIGHEDIGPQDRPVGAGTLDLEAAVGRRGRDVSLDPEDASLSDAGGGREEEMRDVDELSVAVAEDANDDRAAGVGGAGTAADADVVDASAPDAEADPRAHGAQDEVK